MKEKRVGEKKPPETQERMDEKPYPIILRGEELQLCPQR